MSVDHTLLATIGASVLALFVLLGMLAWKAGDIKLPIHDLPITAMTPLDLADMMGYARKPEAPANHYRAVNEAGDGWVWVPVESLGRAEFDRKFPPFTPNGAPIAYRIPDISSDYGT